MTPTQQLRRLALGALAAAFGAAAFAQHANAALFIKMQEIGSDVVLTASGSIDLDGLTPHGQSNNNGLLIPSLSVVSLAPPSPNFAATDWYTGVSAPANFGSGGVTNPTSFSGNLIDFDIGILYLAQGYSSKTPLAATETFAGATFISLGVVPGTYTWHWGSVDRRTFDTMTLEISNVPEPASLAMIGVGLAAASAIRRRKRA